MCDSPPIQKIILTKQLKINLNCHVLVEGFKKHMAFLLCSFRPTILENNVTLTR